MLGLYRFIHFCVLFGLQAEVIAAFARLRFCSIPRWSTCLVGVSLDRLLVVEYLSLEYPSLEYPLLSVPACCAGAYVGTVRLDGGK